MARPISPLVFAFGSLTPEAGKTGGTAVAAATV
jgi:hypothetical protein